MYVRALLLLVLIVGSVRSARAEDAIDESHVERGFVSGDGIKIEVSWWTMTGTTHVADELVITTKRGKLRLQSDEESGNALPLVEKVYDAGRGRWVVLGWSSFGGGMETVHAWIVDATPRVLDKLEWTTDRSHAGVAVDTSSGVRVGIPLPIVVGDDDEEPGLHDDEDWRLAHGTRNLSLANVNKLPAIETPLASLPGYYTPPFQTPPSERHWSGRIVWFAAGKRFQNAPPPRKR
jgi:hypothetical protein